jgi:hypothetical protein
MLKTKAKRRIISHIKQHHKAYKVGSFVLILFVVCYVHKELALWAVGARFFDVVCDVVADRVFPDWRIH